MPTICRDTPVIASTNDTLVERLRSGDRSVFEALVAPEYGVARGLAARLLGNLDDAEDAVQDALLKTYRSLASFRGTRARSSDAAQEPLAGFRPWFLRIVYHQCLDARRRREARRRHEDKALPAPPADALALLEQRESLARVTAAMVRLPTRCQAALHLRVVEELSYAELASILGITPGSARVYVVRARAALREQLGEDLP